MAKKITLSSLKSSPKKTTKFKSGWREIDNKKNYYRSRWEFNYALYLEWLKQRGQIRDWNHETTTFWFEGIRRGVVSYLPDFDVDNIDGSKEFHEVKGYFDSRSKTKIKRMAKYHPQIKLIVIGKKEYQQIEKNMSRLLGGWE